MCSFGLDSNRRKDLFMGNLFKLAEKLGLRNYLHSIVHEELTLRELTQRTLSSDLMGISKTKRSQQLIVSLTSFGERVHDVYLTIESLLQQSIQPDRIILWLNEPLSLDFLPALLERQKRRGLEVEVVSDYRSYDKLIHALKAYPEATIVTVDDDVIYPFDFLEHLYYAHLQEPQTIFFYRGHQIKISTTGEIQPYLSWKGEQASTSDSILNFPTGNGGILYPPHSLHPQVLDCELFQRLAPTADDIWFRAMSLLQGTPCKRIVAPRHNFQQGMQLKVHQDLGLMQVNIAQQANDSQLQNVFAHFNLFPLFKASLNREK